MCVCDPGLLQLWSRSAAVPPAVLEPEKQKHLGEPNVDGAPGRAKNDQKGDKRGGALGSSFPGFSSRASLCDGLIKSHMRDK